MTPTVMVKLTLTMVGIKLPLMKSTTNVIITLPDLPMPVNSTNVLLILTTCTLKKTVQVLLLLNVLVHTTPSNVMDLGIVIWLWLSLMKLWLNGMSIMMELSPLKMVGLKKTLITSTSIVTSTRMETSKTVKSTNVLLTMKTFGELKTVQDIQNYTVNVHTERQISTY